MKVLAVINNFNEFGGLEEFAKNLAIGIQNQGCQVSFLTTTWVPPQNQYVKSLQKHGIRIIHLPKTLSLILSDWDTKERILAITLAVLLPVIFLLSLGVAVLRRKPFRQAFISARNWLQGRLMDQIIGPDRRKPWVILLLNWWRRHWQPNVIHIQGYTDALLFVIDWAYAKGIPVVYEEHQTPDAQFDWWKDFKTTINKASVVVAVSETSARGLREVCGVTQPIAVVYYLVPDPYEEGWSDAPQPCGNHRPIQVTTSARLYVTKGLTYLLDAIVKVRSVYPETQFKVYGDGPLRGELLEYAASLGLDGGQIFVGPYTSREDLSKIMAQTDIFVMSSILEGLPIAMLEAMSYGRSIVVTAVGGIPEAIQDGVNGFICKPRDPACLAENITRLIADPSMRLQLGREARESYLKGPYHPSSVSQKYIDIYKSILSVSVKTAEIR